MKINMKVFIINELKNFLLYKFKNIKSLLIVIIKYNNINKIIMLSKAKFY